MTECLLTAIDELRDSVTNAIVAGDAAAHANLCSEDVRLLHAGSPIITGRAELEAHNAAMFEAVAVTSLVLTPVEIYGTGDIVYEFGTQELTIEPTVPEFAGSRKYVHVFHSAPFLARHLITIKTFADESAPTVVPGPRPAGRRRDPRPPHPSAGNPARW
jgi:ketosteroid isomerase-like protein